MTGVPKTVVNDQIEILGGIPQDDFVEQALGDSQLNDIDRDFKAQVASRITHDGAEDRRQRRSPQTREQMPVPADPGVTPVGDA